MWWRIAVKIAGWTGLQVLFFVLIYEIAFNLIAEHGGYPRPDLGYGIQLHYSLYLLCLLCVINSTVKVTSSGFKLPSLIVALICTGVWVVVWLNTLGSHPYRTALAITAGIISFSIPVLVNYVSAYRKLKQATGRL